MCVSVNWVWSIILFPFISNVQHNSRPYLPFLFRINFFQITCFGGSYIAIATLCNYLSLVATSACSVCGRYLCLCAMLLEDGSCE